MDTTRHFHLELSGTKWNQASVRLLMKSFLMAFADFLAVSFLSAGGTGDR